MDFGDFLIQLRDAAAGVDGKAAPLHALATPGTARETPDDSQVASAANEGRS
jgi:hypothetical protein